MVQPTGQPTNFALRVTDFGLSQIVTFGMVQASVGQKTCNSNIFKSFFYRSLLANFHVSDA
jgi:hypothetical protein